MVAYEFPIEGGAISQNHGYEMLSALSKVAPFIHGRSDVQIAPVGGFRLNSGSQYFCVIGIVRSTNPRN